MPQPRSEERSGASRSWNSRTRRAQQPAQLQIRFAERDRQTSPATRPDYIAPVNFLEKFAVPLCTQPLHLEYVSLQAMRCPGWRERLHSRDASRELLGTG